jgi:hypothetical protein
MNFDAIDSQPSQCSPRRLVPTTLRAGFAALAIAGLAPLCLAADSMSSLGSAFRPQGVADVPAAPAAGSGQQGTNLPGLRVVVSGASRSVATIDGQIVHVGDVVNGMRVTQINPTGVVLVGEGGVSERLTINPAVVKRKLPATATHISNGVRQ